jgi:hypothetical protein
MRRYFIEFFTEEQLAIKGETFPIPTTGNEVYVNGHHYSVMSVLYDLDHNRIQIYLQKRL